MEEGDPPQDPFVLRAQVIREIAGQTEKLGHSYYVYREEIIESTGDPLVYTVLVRRDREGMYDDDGSIVPNPESPGSRLAAARTGGRAPHIPSRQVREYLSHLEDDPSCRAAVLASWEDHEAELRSG